MLIKYTIQITNSHTEVTSPRSGGTKAAQKLILHFIRIRHCDRLFWCDWKQILTRCSYKKLWKPTAFTLSLRHGRTIKPSIRGRPKGPRATCIKSDLHGNERRWKWKRNKLLVPFNTVVEQRYRICFWISRNNRVAQNFRLNGICIRHSDVFVLRSMWFCDVLRSFIFSYSYINNGLNPAAGFWRFFFIDSRNTHVKLESRTVNGDEKCSLISRRVIYC